MRLRTSTFLASLLLVACGGEGADPAASGFVATLESGVELDVSVVYESTNFSGSARGWIPQDLTPATNGTLWVIQRVQRAGGFDDFTECDSRGLAGAGPNDCLSLLGSTVELRTPEMATQATEANGRAELISDPNSLHFMRRPSGIAFGLEEIVLPASAEVAAGLSEDAVFGDIFATCHEHWTGNPTDQLLGGSPSAPEGFIGPSLWTADRDIYDGENGTLRYGFFDRNMGDPFTSNGDHLDMVHGTRYCVGIAWQRDNRYWMFNGEDGALDMYDFGLPHAPGADDHSDATVERVVWSDGGLRRVPDVPSNVVVDGDMVLVSDSGNGRILEVDTAAQMPMVGMERTYEAIDIPVFEDPPTTVVADEATLRAEWGGNVIPSGLALIDADTLVVGNWGSGHLTFLDRNDGSVIRTYDTGLGAGLGGVTWFEGAVYFTHIDRRAVYRLDVVIAE
jgi:hypothetical protein